MRYAALILILLAGTLSADESKSGKSYLCVPDKSTGFKFNEKSGNWEQTIFTTDEKFLVRPTSEDEGEDVLGYEVTETGDENPFVSCEEGLTRYGWISCGSSFISWTMNVYSMRFIHYYRGGYINSALEMGVHDIDLVEVDGKFGDPNTYAKRIKDKGGDTPFVTIGKCSAL